MYNGIGLTTARGSGTNGFVQRNMSHVPNKQKRIEYKSEDDLKRLESEMSRGPNPEILKHARKRQIELKCLEMHELMEEQGYKEDEIEMKVSKFRKMLFEKDAALDESKVTLEKDAFGRIIARDTHEIAQAQAEKNRRFKEALGLPSNYVDGSSLEKLGKQEEPKQKAEPQYRIIDEPVSETDQPPSRSWKERKSSESGSSEREIDSKKKTKKHKKSKVKSEQRDPDSDEGSLSRSRSRSNSRSKHQRRKHEKPRGRSRSRSKSRSSDDSSGGRHVRKSNKKHHSSKRHRRDDN